MIITWVEAENAVKIKGKRKQNVLHSGQNDTTKWQTVPICRVVLVLWYKDAFGKPIYSFDLRGERGSDEAVIPAMESQGRSELIKSRFRREFRVLLSEMQV